MTPKQANFFLLIQALSTNPAKVAATATDTGITVTAWKNDHPRIVGSKGNTIYAIKKIGEHIGVRVVLTEPEPDIHGVKAPAKFNPRAILDGLHKAAGAAGLTTEGDTIITVRNCQLSPDFLRAVGIAFFNAGKAQNERWEVIYA